VVEVRWSFKNVLKHELWFRSALRIPLDESVNGENGWHAQGMGVKYISSQRIQ
jgi:hypothetical protein